MQDISSTEPGQDRLPPALEQEIVAEFSQLEILSRSGVRTRHLPDDERTEPAEFIEFTWESHVGRAQAQRVVNGLLMHSAVTFTVTQSDRVAIRLAEDIHARR